MFFAALILATPLAGSFILPDRVAAANWLADNWGYRREITITGNGSDLTDIQYQLTGIDTQTLYNEGKLQFNCQDVRFTNANGALLHYWIEDDDTPCATDTGTDFWIRLPRAESEGTTIYMYYGNPDAAPYSSGSNTFTFFDGLGYSPAAWYNSSWSYRKRLTVNHTRVFDSTVSSFPVYIDMSLLGDDFWTGVDAQGDDVVVTAADGTTKLPRELVTIDAGTKSGELWFNAPSLSSTEDSYFYIYYGNGSATETNDTDTWNSAFTNVFHFDDNPTVSVTDSKGGVSGTSAGSMTSGDEVAAKVGNGLDFDGNDDRVDFTGTTSDIAGPWTLSMWIYNRDTANTFAILFDSATYSIRLEQSGTNNLGYTRYSAADYNAGYRLETSAWKHVTYIDTGSQMRILVDGVQVFSSATRINLPRTRIGLSATHAINGVLDESKLSNVARSDGWIRTEISNQSDPDGFITASGQEATSGSYDRLLTAGSPVQTDEGTIELSDPSGIEGLQSQTQYAINSKAVFRVSQSSTALNAGRLGFSNTSFAGGTMFADDAAYVVLNSAVTNWDRSVRNDGTATNGTGSIAETTALSEFEVGWRTGGVDFRVNNASNGSLTTNVPNESSYIRLESDNTADTITLDWVAVATYNADPPDSQVVGSEEKSQAPLLSLSFEESGGQTLLNTGSIGSAAVSYTGDSIFAASDDPYRTQGCPTGRCLSFDGSNDSVTVDHHALLNTTQFSFSMWYKPASTSTQYGLINKHLSPSAGWWVRQQSDGTVRFLIVTASGNIYVTTSASLPVATWTHITGTYDGTTPRIYFNGIEAAGTVTNPGNSGSATTSTRPLKIGESWADNENTRGAIDEVRLWPRGISADEVLREYNSYSAVLGAGTSRIEEGLAAWWQMNELTWNGTSGEVKDSSGSSYHGTAVSGTVTTPGYFGRAGSFDGTNDYISTGARTVDEPPYSICAWTQADVAAPSENKYIITNGGETGSSNGFSLSLLTSGSYALTMKKSSGVGGTASLSGATTGWTHLCGVWDGSSNADSIRLYRNGTLAATASPGPVSVGADSSLLIGRPVSTNDFHWDGRLDDVRVYNRLLSEPEISSIYNYSPGPLAQWRFDEQSGTTVKDDTLNAIDGSLVNMNDAKRVPGLSGNALDFDGSGDYVSFSSDALLPLSSQNRSFSLWVSPRTLVSGDRYFSMGNWAVGNSFDIVSNTSNRISVVGHTNNYLSTAAIPLSTWTHVGIVLNGTNLRFYLNGKLDSSHTVSLNTVASGEFRIGGVLPSRGATDYDGYIDDFVIWGHALTAQEMENIYAYGTAANSLELGDTFNSELIAYWKMDETSWNGTTDEVIDIAGGDHDGTRVGNATTSADAKFGRAGTFDGNGDYVNVPYSSAFTTSTFTVSAWIKPDVLGQNRTIITTEPNSTPTQNGFGIRLRSDNKFWLTIGRAGNSASVSSTKTATAGTWTQVTATYDGVTAKIYIDGEPDGTAVINRTVDSTQALRIGWFSSSFVNEAFDGQIDDVRLYGVQLEEMDIETIYNRFNTVYGGSEFETGARPVLQHNFDQKSGTTANDSSGNSFNATLFNMDSTNWVDGRYGNALQFNGSNEYASIANQTQLNSTDFSVSAWIRTTSSGVSRVLTKEGNTNGQQRYSLGANVSVAGRADVSFYGTSVNTAQSTSSVNDGEWHHILGTFSDTNNRLRIYVDGVLQATTTTTQSPVASSNPLEIGRFDSAAGQYFNGSIDQVRYWERELSPREAAIEFDGGKPVAWYKFDEIEGNTAYDHSGNGVHGTLTNMSVPSVWQEDANCKYNGCLSFDGSNDYISVPHNNVQNQNSVSISLWARFTTLATRPHVVTKGISGSAGKYALVIETNGMLRLFYDTGSGWTSVSSPAGLVSVNEWHHFVVTYTPGSTAVYYDGRRVGSAAPAGNLRSITNAISIGNFQAGGYGHVSGRIDEVKIWNYALTQDDINREYYANGAALRYE